MLKRNLYDLEIAFIVLYLFYFHSLFLHVMLRKMARIKSFDISVII